MMIRSKARAEAPLDTSAGLPAPGTPELWAAHPVVTGTPGHALAHVSPGDTGTRAREVTEPADVLTVLV